MAARRTAAERAEAAEFHRGLAGGEPAPGDPALPGRDERSSTSALRSSIFNSLLSEDAAATKILEQQRGSAAHQVAGRAETIPNLGSRALNFYCRA